MTVRNFPSPRIILSLPQVFASLSLSLSPFYSLVLGKPQSLEPRCCPSPPPPPPRRRPAESRRRRAICWSAPIGRWTWISATTSTTISGERSQPDEGRGSWLVSWVEICASSSWSFSLIFSWARISCRSISSLRISVASRFLGNRCFLEVSS